MVLCPPGMYGMQKHGVVHQSRIVEKHWKDIKVRSWVDMTVNFWLWWFSETCREFDPHYLVVQYYESHFHRFLFRLITAHKHKHTNY